MRLFVAIEVGPSIAESGREVIDELRRRVGQHAARARVTWVAPERLHVTVRFIGQSDETRTQTILAALSPPIDVHPFELSVENIGAFPGRGAPRVLWAGLTGGRDGVLQVERAVSQRLDSLVTRDERPYNPHLTLGRVKHAAGLQSAALFRDLATSVLGTVHVEAITLFESRLSSKGATYVPLQQTALV